MARALAARSGKVWLMIDSVAGKMHAAGAPIRTRSEISAPVLVRMPATALATAKTESPAARTRLLP